MKKKKISKASKAFYIALSYLSPRLNTKLLFLKKFGRFPDLKDPKTLNEKILKLKLETYGRDPLVRQCADKYCVREYPPGFFHLVGNSRKTVFCLLHFQEQLFGFGGQQALSFYEPMGFQQHIFIFFKQNFAVVDHHQHIRSFIQIGSVVCGVEYGLDP